ncbi:MAG TPA: glycosyltransferase family 4 protein [Candidatus Acidoferrales bacterium]|nr:glycosyltransferase family 4 protein [Candidatus Acidoferrales bacterium]
MGGPASRRLNVAFLQSQAFFGADSAVHEQLMRHLDRESVNVFCAATDARVAAPRETAIDRVRAIPDLRLRVVDFGPTLFGRSRSARLLAAVPAARAGIRAIPLIRYLRRERIDIVHGTEKPRDAFVGSLLARAAGAAMVVHMHVGFDPWISPRVRWAIGAADAVIGVSRFVSASLVAAGFDPGRVFTVHNSLDLADGRWEPRRDRASVRRELGLGLDAPVVCIASRIFRWKGHDDLVEAIARVRVALPNVRLLIVGEHDPRADGGGGSYREELEARIARLGLGDCVRFTGYRSDIADLMSAADVFCQPSAAEPFGMVYLEAMAVRRPVVAYASGGAPEVVQDGVTGMLARNGDVAGLASALTTLLADERLRRRLGDAGRARVEQVFRPEASAAALLDVYRTVAARRGRYAALMARL